MTATAEQISQISVALASCDTVDGYSLLGTSGLDTIDVNGDPIAPGVEVINFYDASGEYLNSCEKEGPDGWAELGVAVAETVDINGDPIAPGTEVIDFYDANGVYVASCKKAVADGYATQGIAVADTVDADGNPIPEGEPVINFYDGDGVYLDSCLKEGPDGYSNQGVAGADTVDSNGNPIAPGTPVVDYYDENGDYIDSCSNLALIDEVCGEDANGTACPGATTRIYGNICTGEAVKRISSRSELKFARLGTAQDFISIYGANTIDPALMSAGDIVPFLGTLTWTQTSPGIVMMDGLWSLVLVNVAIDSKFEISINGGAWFSPSGGGNDFSTYQSDQAGSIGAEPYVPEQWQLFLGKGTHTINMRLTINQDPQDLRNEWDTWRVGAASSNFRVWWVEETCLEVAV